MMTWRDPEAKKTRVFLDGARQSHVVEAQEGETGFVRKLLSINGVLVMSPTGRGVSEVIEYGKVELKTEKKP